MSYQCCFVCDTVLVASGTALYCPKCTADCLPVTPEPTLTLPKSRIEAALREAWAGGWCAYIDHSGCSDAELTAHEGKRIARTLAELEQP